MLKGVHCTRHKDTHTDGHTDTKATTEDTYSEFQESFLQPIYKSLFGISFDGRLCCDGSFQLGVVLIRPILDDRLKENNS